MIRGLIFDLNRYSGQMSWAPVCMDVAEVEL